MTYETKDRSFFIPYLIYYTIKTELTDFSQIVSKENWFECNFLMCFFKELHCISTGRKNKSEVQRHLLCEASDFKYNNVIIFERIFESPSAGSVSLFWAKSRNTLLIV